MTIINPLPYTIANGNPVDATAVEANFSQIVANVNANAAPVAGNASQQFLVATTANPAGAVPLAQAQSQFAPISGGTAYAPAAGNSSQTFAVASGTGNSAVPYTQMQSYVSAAAPATSGSSTQTFAVGAAPIGSTDAPQIAQTVGGGGGYSANLAGTTRGIGGNYTNNTSRPLVVTIAGSATVNVNSYLNANLYLTGVGTIAWQYITNEGTTSTYYVLTVFAIIPPGGSYSYQLQSTSASNLMLQFWYEY